MPSNLPSLPHGWRLRNSAGELNGPPLEEDGSDSGSDVSALDIKPDSEGWEDVEDDTEVLSIKCLLCEQTFPQSSPMLAHCTEAHGLDLGQIRKKCGLDFYGTIKLVNYIRSQVQSGVKLPDTSDASLWADDKYLQPALEDDALLFSLDDLDESAGEQEPASA